MRKVITKIHSFREKTFMLSVKLLFVISMIYLVWTFSRKQQDIAWSLIFNQFFTGKWIAWSFTLATLNWFLRIYKWKLAVSTIEKISLKTASVQQLTAFAWSVFTPANAGEFLHKPLFFQEKKAVAKAVFHEQLSQMIITLFLGLLALSRLYTHPLIFKLFLGFTVLTTIWTIRSRTYFFKLILLSLLRYFSFGLFLYLGLHQAGMTNIHTAWMIPVYFLVVSFLPLLPWTDIPVKSSVALWIFASQHSGASLILVLIFWLWTWNTFLPALTGQILGIHKTLRI